MTNGLLNRDQGEMKSPLVNYVAQEDPNYEWRVRIDLRQGIDMPMNPLKPNNLPSMYFEIAWSEGFHPDTIIPETKLTSMVVEDNRHPNWN